MRKLAVLMPVYNCALYINEAIASILNQTFVDFDFYIYDDCSTDDTATIIAQYADARIFYIKNDVNLGIAKTLNLGLEKLLPEYQYIARMDGDDWSFSDRFQKQIVFMEQHLDVALCGSQGYWLKDLNQNLSPGWTYPTENEYLKIYLLFGASFGHSSVVMRSSIFTDEKLFYNETIKTCEDWDLWIRVADKNKITNLPLFLMKYRITATSNHRSIENKFKHLQERSAIIADYWKTFDIYITPAQVFEYYYITDSDLIKKDFYNKLKILIYALNCLFFNHAQTLIFRDRNDFAYMLSRKILNYWKRSGNSRYNLKIWFLIFENVKFISYFKLFKSQLR